MGLVTGILGALLAVAGAPGEQPVPEPAQA
jgi:hypothetical protein